MPCENWQMAEPIWINATMAQFIHDDQIAAHGGAYGVLNAGMLESALARPQNLYAYKEADIFALAAAYGYGIAKNHAFIDGNKRTAFLVMFTFLKVNGWHLIVPEPDAVITIQQVAASIMTEALLAAWLEKNSSTI
jgi:death on curing protein